MKPGHFIRVLIIGIFSLLPIVSCWLPEEGNGPVSIIQVYYGDEIVNTDIPVDLGYSSVGYSDDFTFSVKNTSTEASLNLLGLPIIQISGTGFSVKTSPSFLLDPGESSDFTITCEPSEAKNYTGNVYIENDDEIKGDYQFSIAVEAGYGEMTVSSDDGGETQVLEDDEGYLDLGNHLTSSVPFGEDYEYTVLFLIENNSNFTIGLTGDPVIGLSLDTDNSGGDTGTFFVTTPPDNTTIAPGESTLFAVTMSFARLSSGTTVFDVVIPNSNIISGDYNFKVEINTMSIQ